MFLRGTICIYSRYAHNVMSRQVPKESKAEALDVEERPTTEQQKKGLGLGLPNLGRAPSSKVQIIRACH